MKDCRSPASSPIWHILQVSDVLDLEFASALAESVPVLAWEPLRSFFPARIRPGAEAERLATISPGANAPDDPNKQEPRIRLRQLPLLRGFARPPLSYIARTGPSVLARLLKQTPDPKNSPLICTVPFFASVAEHWPGPVIYWLTDLIAEYSSANRSEVVRLDRRLCKVATLVCPNSERLKSYLVETAKCDPDKIEIVPNATRASNLLPAPPSGPEPLPGSARSIQRPVAGVIGNLAGNMDWLLLQQVIDQTPWLSWVFVGPTSMEIADPAARMARASIMQHPRTCFTGRQPYGELAHYARAFDVAVLPYRRCEPTWSGSSTRFYEHLAACRPMVAANGLEELTRKQPLLILIETADEAVRALVDLRACNFDDHLATARWNASHQGTWQFRANTVRDALASRLIGSPSNRGAV
jgi:glycosyltransferase involved in cell wall biosynthesis